mmetsp:Transcript_56278/g.132615  ORF Transcript_56278/g.132615 Transcript_56278/m.132615 type:complete len:152 (+) Transcript_56278:105-560(+)
MCRLLAVVALTTLMCVSAAPTKCIMSTPGDPTSMEIPADAGDDVQCVRYCFTCTSDDTACTAGEIETSAVKPAYIYNIKETIDQMKTMPSVYINLFACTTDDCNVVAADACTATPASEAEASDAIQMHGGVGLGALAAFLACLVMFVSVRF